MIKQNSEGSQMFWHQPIHFSPIKKPSMLKNSRKIYILSGNLSETSISSSSEKNFAINNVNSLKSMKNKSEQEKNQTRSWNHLKVVVKAVHLFKTNEVQNFKEKVGMINISNLLRKIERNRKLFGSRATEL